MTIRFVPALVAVAGVALALSGCSSALEGVTGITVSGGHVEAVVQMCSGVTADEVHMIPAGGQFFLLPHPSWHFKSAGSTIVNLGKTSDFLELVGSDDQRLQSSSSGGVGGLVYFSADDIKSLGKGEILTIGATSSDYLRVDASQFKDLADKTCATN